MPARFLRRMIPWVMIMSLPSGAGAGVPLTGLRASVGSPLVLVQSGDVPILLTAPHGGTEEVPGVPVRSAKHPPGGDPNTLEITLELAARLEAILGARPFVVAAKFHRRYIDANRPPAAAYEDADAVAHYRAYHDEIAAFVAEMENRWPGRGFLLDVHGNSAYRGFLRGTDDGRTMARLRARYGDEVVIGPHSVFGLLAAAGYRVYPPLEAPLSHPRERRRYRGGFTCSTYGTKNPGGINTMQIECGEEIWTRWESHPEFVDELARALAEFYRSYLAAE